MNAPNELLLRHKMLSVAQAMVTQRLNRGTSGNLSCRNGDHFLITPSGCPVDQLQADDMVALRFDGAAISCGTPSSEWRFHRDIFQSRSDVGAVVHCHSPFASTISCLRIEVPPLHYMIALAGGNNIRCAGYALFGTEDLSAKALAALEGRKACLLANHGLIAIGSDLDEALRIAIEVEFLCEQYWRVLQIGNPVLLSDSEMKVVLSSFKSYCYQSRTKN